MIVNITKSEKQNILDLLRTSKSVDISVDQADISNPTAIPDSASFNRDNPNTGYNPNTQVTITARTDSVSHVGSATLKYRRIILEEAWLILHKTTNIKYTKENIPTLNEENVKTLVKSLFKFIENSVDISVNISNKNATATLTSKTNSLIYTGNLTINLTPADTRQNLSEIITTDNLQGFEYETKLNVESMTIPSFIYGL